MTGGTEGGLARAATVTRKVALFVRRSEFGIVVATEGSPVNEWHAIVPQGELECRGDCQSFWVGRNDLEAEQSPRLCANLAFRIGLVS